MSELIFEQLELSELWSKLFSVDTWGEIPDLLWCGGADPWWESLSYQSEMVLIPDGESQNYLFGPVLIPGAESLDYEGDPLWMHLSDCAALPGINMEAIEVSAD